MTDFRKLLSALVLTLSLVACGEDEVHEGDDHDHDPVVELNEEACEHLVEGPFAAVSAVTEATQAAPAVAPDHRTYTVALPEAETDGYAGYVRVDSAEAADYLFFADVSVNITVTDAEGAEVEIEESATSIDECTQVKGRHVVELGVGRYFLHLSGDSETVNLLVEEMHDDHGDH